MLPVSFHIDVSTPGTKYIISFWISSYEISLCWFLLRIYLIVYLFTFTPFKISVRNLYHVRSSDGMTANHDLLIHFHNATAPSGPGPPHCQGFTITPQHTTPGKTRVHDWSAWNRVLYLTTHNTHKIQSSMTSTEFYTSITARDWQQTHASDGAATAIGTSQLVSEWVSELVS